MERQDAGKEIGVAGVGDHASPAEHVRPPGALGGDDEIGQEGQHPPGAGHRARDRAHDRRLHLPQPLEEVLVVHGQVAVVERVGDGRLVGATGDVGARAEVAVAAGDDDGAHPVVGVQGGEPFAQLHARVEVDHVALLGAVQRDDGDGARLLDAQRRSGFGAHGLSGGGVDDGRYLTVVSIVRVKGFRLMPPSSNLARLLWPQTFAVVGANEKLGMSNNAVVPMLEAGRTVHLVNPNRDVLYGRPALPSLSAIGAPVDAVLSLVNAERSIDVVEEAASMGCGGVVVAAAGFVEMGEGGAVVAGSSAAGAAAEGGFAVMGPNCSGFKNVPLGGQPVHRRPVRPDAGRGVSSSRRAGSSPARPSPPPPSASSAWVSPCPRATRRSAIWPITWRCSSRTRPRRRSAW